VDWGKGIKNWKHIFEMFLLLQLSQLIPEPSSLHQNSLSSNKEVLPFIGRVLVLVGEMYNVQSKLTVLHYLCHKDPCTHRILLLW